MSKFNNIIRGNKPVLVDFYADWCGPCKTLSPIIQQVAQSVQGEARVLKINVDKNQALANKYNVRSIPTVMLFKGGKVQWRKAGVMPKQEIERAIRQHL